MVDDDNIQQGTDSGIGDNSDNNLGMDSQGVSEFSIPDEYKEKGWARFFDGKTGDELKSELFKSYDNSQSMIGKKVIDYLSNTDLRQLSNYEEIKKNLSAQLTPEYNVPENATDYGFENLIKETFGENPTYQAEGINNFQDKFKELGISKEQGQGIMKAYMDYQVEEFQKFTNADELEADINQMFKGNVQQRTQCESLIKEFLPPQDQKFIQDTMPNAVVEMFYKVAKGLVDKYDYKEGYSAQGGSSLTMTQQQKDEEYTRLTSEIEALSHRPHSEQEKQNLINQLMALYK